MYVRRRSWEHAMSRATTPCGGRRAFDFRLWHAPGRSTARVVFPVRPVLGMNKTTNAVPEAGAPVAVDRSITV